MSRIFVSYRRSDNQDATGRIYDRLSKQFGKDNIFKDVDSLPLGVDYRKELSEVVGQCKLFLAVVGTRWLDAQDETGKRRLDSASDFVRIEIEAALARGIPVIPVLVGNAEMPSESDLPASLSPLAFRQGISVRPDPDFHRDMDRLSNALQTMLHAALTAPKSVIETPDTTSTRDSENASPAEPEISTALEATPAEVQTVRGMLARLTTNGLNKEINQLVPVARELLRSGHGREVLSLCEVIRDTKVSDVDRYKAIKLLALAIRQQHAKPFMDVALDTLLDYGVLSGALQTASLEAIMMASATPKAKWERLFGSLDLANEGQLYAIIGSLQITPASERQVTGARLTELLETATSTTSQICMILKQIGYRAAVPALITILETSTTWKAVTIAEVLVTWRVVEAIPAIRQAIENARYGSDHAVASLMKHLYALEGAVAAGYLADVLRDAVPAIQGYMVETLGDVNDSGFCDVVADLVRTSPDESTKKKAQSFLQKRGIVS